MRVYVLKESGRGFYRESPEDQGLAEGDSVIRAFAWLPEAQRYLEAVSEYAGVSLSVVGLNDSVVKSMASKLRPSTKMELCRMRKNEWPQAVNTQTNKEVQ